MSVLFICVLILIIAILSYKYFRQTLQIKEIRRVINAMAIGDYSRRMVLSPSDNLGDVARNVHELAYGIQKRLEELTIEKDKLEAILSNMAEGVLVISFDNRLLHLSPSFQFMFDVRSTDWKNKYYWEIISNQNIIESITEGLTHKSILRKEIVILRSKEMYFNMQISPVFDSHNVLISLIVVFHDVTELKKFERLRSEFVANVSHELKTPLTSIRGFVETLKEGALDDKANAVRFLNIILNQTQRLENLVNDLLVLSSLESKDVKMNLVKGDISNIIHAVILMKKKQIEDLQHALILDIPTNLPLVSFDAARMEQVFLNILDNAVKFTPRGGKILIKARVEGRFVRIDFRDNGPGISSEYLNRIFERFFRVDKSRSQETGGTGLGLSIAKHIMDVHQGKISVESTLGNGSTFSVFLNLDML